MEIVPFPDAGAPIIRARNAFTAVVIFNQRRREERGKELRCRFTSIEIVAVNSETSIVIKRCTPVE